MTPEGTPRAPAIEELLQHEGWLRELVRSLVGDDEGEDVLQETWMTALERAPRDLGSARAWLTQVARRLAWRRHRSRARRGAREGAAAREDVSPEPEHMLQELELQQRLARALVGLREPLRTCVYLRYYEGLSYAELSARLGTSEANVRQRCKRGLDALRGELADELGPDRTSGALAALVASWDAARGLPVAPPAAPPASATLPPAAPPVSALPSAAPAPSLFASVFAMKIALALAAAVVAWLGWTLWDTRPNAVELEAPVTKPTRESEVVAATTPIEQRAPEEAERVAAPAVQPAAVEEEAVEALAPLRGRVVDATGRPLADVPLGVRLQVPEFLETDGATRAEDDERKERGRSGAEGTFEFACGDKYGSLVTLDRVTVCASSFGETADQRGELLVIAAPSVELAGEVLDPEGRPLAGVDVNVSDPDLNQFPGVLDHTRRVHCLGGASDEFGRFHLRGVPGGTVEVEYALAGYVRQVVPVAEFSELTQRIVLQPLEAAPWTVRGRVSDPTGAWLAGVRVGMGKEHAISDADGGYELTFPADGPPMQRDALFAVHPGLRPVSIDELGGALLESEERTLERDLTFAGETLSIEGHVLGEAGEPLSDMWVYLWRQRKVDGAHSLEELSVDTAREKIDFGPGIRVYARSAEDGSFRIDGLGERDYELRIVSADLSHGWLTGPIAAGSRSVEVRAPGPLVWEEVRGTVVGRDGAPIEDVLVQLHACVYDSISGSYSRGIGSAVRTNASGAFRVLDVPRHQSRLTFGGDELVATSRLLEPDQSPLELRVEMDRRCHFRVELPPDLEQAVAFSLYDAQGERLVVYAMQTGGSISSVYWTIENGETRVLTVTEGAREAVFFDADGGEISRVPIRLGPDEVRTIP